MSELWVTDWARAEHPQDMNSHSKPGETCVSSLTRAHTALNRLSGIQNVKRKSEALTFHPGNISGQGKEMPRATQAHGSPAGR